MTIAVEVALLLCPNPFMSRVNEVELPAPNGGRGTATQELVGNGGRLPPPFVVTVVGLRGYEAIGEPRFALCSVFLLTTPTTKGSYSAFCPDCPDPDLPSAIFGNKSLGSPLAASVRILSPWQGCTRNRAE